MSSGKGYRIGTALAVLAASFALTGCKTRVSGNATANAPVAYSHVYVTIEQVWVNASATAGPDDSAWIKQTLDTPQTIDLVGLTNGTLKEFASTIPVPSGTYNQLRLILSDTSASLTSSAQTAGAQFNNEVDYFDSSGVAQRAALEVPNVTGGVAVPIKLDVQTTRDAILAAIGSASSSTTANSTSANSTNTTSTNTTSTSTNTTTTAATSTSGGDFGTTVAATAAVVFDANRDIARFAYTNQVGFALNARLTGQDLATVGTIRSQLSLGSLTLDASTSRPDVQVTAEMPSADDSRNVPVLSAPLRSDGTFILYPFPMDSGAPTTYDLVIHGPKIRTFIIKSVPVQSGTPSSAATVNLGSPALVLASSTYLVNAATANPVAPRGARVGFYQTLNASGELPYLIEERTVDPITGLFALDQSVSGDNVASGTYNSGSTVTLTATTPVEGTGAYKLAASAVLYGDGAFGDTLTPPAAGTTTTTTFNAPSLSVPTSALSGTITATVNVTSPGRYDKGALVITHDGAIVSVMLLDAVLVPAQASGTLTITSIPAGDSSATFDGGTYYAEAWAWNSNDPAGTFVREPAGTLIDLRTATTASVTLTVN